MSALETRTVQSWFGPIRTVQDPEYDRYWPRKFRGRRRYYRSLRRNAARFEVRPTGWYDYMHWHADWSGVGNTRWRERREHLAAIFTMFRRLLGELKDFDAPHQTWLFIDPYDSSQDAVCLHTPNPNAANFPHRFDDTEWDGEVPPRLREFLTDSDWQFGRVETYGTAFIVRPRPAASYEPSFVNSPTKRE